MSMEEYVVETDIRMAIAELINKPPFNKVSLWQQIGYTSQLFYADGDFM
ncbi:hypothetical protein GCM10008968_06990 [Bacillus horti]